MVEPPADHAAHDRLLVAEAADRDGRLPAALAACPDCQALHADLVALAAAVPLAALPSRSREFQLSPADAARLRPAGWRRWLAAIGTSRDAVTRPLAIGLTTLGLAGLLVATVPGALPSGGATAGAAPVAGEAQRQSEASPAPSAMPALEAPAAGAGAASAAPAAPSSESMDMSATPEAERAEPGGVFLGGDDPDTVASSEVPGGVTNITDGSAASGDQADPAATILPVIAGAMLLAGLGLFLLRRISRRA